MQRKDILELKRRMKKETCTISRMAGCYVNAQKEKVVTMNERFANLQDEEFFKYLEIARKSLSGTLGNNLLELSFPFEESFHGQEAGDESSKEMGKQQFLLGLKNTGLENADLLDRFYDMIIENYDYAGHYLILLFYDTYDVMVKTEDGQKIDESEEVYSYLLCSLCPITLSKPGLGYLEEEHKIGVRLRDWIVAAPENGFLFPAFSERSTDIDTLLFYTKNVKEPHPDFMKNGLGCNPRRTGTQQKKAFENVVKNALAGSEEDSDEIYISIQESINDRLEQAENNNPQNPATVMLTNETFKEILDECEISDYLTPKFESAFAEEFSDGIPTADVIVDAKLLSKNEQAKKEKELVCEVANLKHALENAQNTTSSSEDRLEDQAFDSANQNNEESTDHDSDSLDENATGADLALYDVSVRIRPDRATQITSLIIDGQKCLIIPVSDEDDINVNGVSYSATE